MLYDSLLKEADRLGLHVQEKKMPYHIKGLYSDNVIRLNKSIPTRTEKACTLVEEIGHHHTSSGNILDQSDTQNRKQELRARQWAYQRLIPLKSFVDVYKARIRDRHDIAEFLGVTEEFLKASVDRYAEKYGICKEFEGRYIIYFEPLRVIEMFFDDRE